MTVLIRIVIVAVVGVVWNAWSNSSFEETFYTMESYKIKEPIRVILLSDLHQKSFGAGNEALLARIEALNPDVILLAGDMLNDKRSDWELVAGLCQRLTEIAPVYYGLGNHENRALYGEDLNLDFLESAEEALDGWSENFVPLLQNVQAWNTLERTGVKLLQNESVTLELNGNTVQIGGLSTNLSSFWPYSGAFITRFVEDDPECFKILISHRPEVAVTYLSDAAIDLTVSGHNHGGIIRVPGIGGLFSDAEGLFPTYDAGWFEFDTMSILVSRGLGGHGVVPRIFNVPELVILDIN